jgi:hypothetical protein
VRISREPGQGTTPQNISTPGAGPIIGHANNVSIPSSPMETLRYTRPSP